MSKETVWDKLRDHISEREERQQQRAISIRHIKEDRNSAEDMINLWKPR